MTHPHDMALAHTCWHYGSGNSYHLLPEIQQWLGQHGISYKLSLHSRLDHGRTWHSPIQVRIAFPQAADLLLFKLTWGGT